jgi:hypothetical protein
MELVLNGVKIFKKKGLASGSRPIIGCPEAAGSRTSRQRNCPETPCILVIIKAPLIEIEAVRNAFREASQGGVHLPEKYIYQQTFIPV